MAQDIVPAPNAAFKQGTVCFYALGDLVVRYKFSEFIRI